MIGIYKIQNKLNGKCYIGQSVDIHRRWNDHKSAAFNQNADCYHQHLYRAMRKYGINQFDFSILEECSRDELDTKEKYYIHQFDSFYNGYNQTFGGDTGGAKMPKEHILGIIHDLETTRMRHQDIADKWGTSKQMVQGINVGRNWHHHRTYPIQPRKDPNRISRSTTAAKRKRCLSTSKTMQYDGICVDCGIKIQPNSTRCVQCHALHNRKVQRPSRDELLLQLSNLPFVRVAAQYGVTDNAIRKWCKQYGLSTKSSDYNIARPDNLPHPTRMVQMCTLNDKPIKTFASPADAAKEFNGKAKSIREVCQGRRKSVYGYHWRYLT